MQKQILAVSVLALMMIGGAGGIFAYRLNTPIQENSQKNLDRKSKEIEISFEKLDPMTGDLNSHKQKYEIGYAVSFDTQLASQQVDGNDSVAPSIVQITGEGFEIELNVMYPPDLAYFSGEYDEKLFSTIKLPNTSTRIIRTLDRSLEETNIYAYYEFGERYFGKDLACTDTTCTDADRFSFREGIKINEEDWEYYVFARCKVLGTNAVTKCDEIIQSIELHKV